MGKRLVSLLTALALAVSAFASLAVAPAGAQTGPEYPDTTIYFPFVPNGEELAGVGPWYGTITIQNVEDEPIIVDIFRSNGGLAIGGIQLNEHGSRTFSSASLLASAVGSFTAIRGAVANGTDAISVGACQASSVSVTQGATVFRQGTDYTWTQTGSTITINWGPAGSEPLAGTGYTVTVSGTNCAFGNGFYAVGRLASDPRTPARITGVMKSAAPLALSSDDARTSSAHESVTGYTALPQQALADESNNLLSSTQWALPIVQSGWNGWNSVIYITNFSNEDNCAVDVTLYESPLGLGDPAPGVFSKNLKQGETWRLDLTGWNEDWAGSAFIDADCAVAVSSDRIKAEQPWGDPVNMAISNVGQPFGEASTEVYAPLVFQRYNGWNTGMAVVNLSDADARVTINFYNMDGNTAGSATLTLRPRAVEWVYRPELTNLGTMSIAQARITANQKVAVAVDEVKYSGTDPDTGQAMSYNAQVGGGTLALPLFQKQGGALASSNDNSGIAIFNPNTVANNVTVTVYNRAGNEYDSIDYRIAPWGSAILYAPEDLPELQGGFTGNVVVTAEDAPVVAVSNNVNYDVQYDGSAAFNLAVVAPFEAPPAPTYQLAVDPASAVNSPDGGTFGSHSITATLTFGGDPVPGVDILFEVTAGPNDGETGSSASPTNVDGEATISYDHEDDGTAGIDTIQVCADLNNTGEIDAGDVCTTATKEWRPTGNLTTDVTQVGSSAVGDGTVDVTATASITPSGNPFVIAIVDGTANASFAACGSPDDNYATSSPAQIYVCNGVAGDSFQVQLVADYNNDGEPDAGEPVIGGPVTITVGP